MDWSTLIIGILTCTNLSTLIIYFSTIKAKKKKEGAEADMAKNDAELRRLDATEKIIEIYKTMYDDVTANYVKQLQELREEVKSLKKFKCEKDPCDNRKQ